MNPLKKKKKFSSGAVDQATKDQKSSYDYLYSLPKDPKTAPLTASAIQTGADPKILDKAKSLLGSQQYNGLCESYIEKVTGMTKKFASAYADWEANKNNAVPLSQAKPGDKIVYAPDSSNSGWGHITVYQGGGKQIGATNVGVKSSNIQDWISSTGQKLLGVIPS